MHGRLKWTDTSGLGLLLTDRRGPLRGWAWIPLTLKPDSTRRRVRKGVCIRLF